MCVSVHPELQLISNHSGEGDRSHHWNGALKATAHLCLPRPQPTPPSPHAPPPPLPRPQIEMARVTGVPMSYLLSRGQSIKVFSQILRKSRTKNLVVPNMKVRRGHPGGVGRRTDGDSGWRRWQGRQLPYLLAGTRRTRRARCQLSPH